MEPLRQSEVSRLTPPERLALISALWDSLEDEVIPLSASQRDELDFRLDALEGERREGVTWETLKSELESRCP